MLLTRETPDLPAISCSQRTKLSLRRQPDDNHDFRTTTEQDPAGGWIRCQPPLRFPGSVEAKYWHQAHPSAVGHAARRRITPEARRYQRNTPIGVCRIYFYFASNLPSTDEDGAELHVCRTGSADHRSSGRTTASSTQNCQSKHATAGTHRRAPAFSKAAAHFHDAKGDTAKNSAGGSESSGTKARF